MDNCYLSDDERLDVVNDDISLIQKKTGLTFGTDALLLASYVEKSKGARALELGGGTGIVSLLVLARDKAETVTAVEIQPYYAELIERNARLNGMEARLFALERDVRELSTEDDGTYHTVMTNPPYMIAGGILNIHPEKAIARHELHGGIDAFCKAAALKLRYGGYFYCVHRPERLTDLLCSMRESGIEPKKLTFVHADKSAPPSLILVKGKRGASFGLVCTPPLFLYTDERHITESADYAYILEKGCFPREAKGDKHE